MGDDLGDEWWLDPSDTSKNDENDDLAGKSEIRGVSHTKRKAESENNEGGQKSSKRKRRTKQKISEYLSKSTPKPATPKEVLTKMDGYFKQKLSPLELEDLQLAESDFLEHNASSLPLSSYLETAVPRWGRDLEAKRPKETKTCLLLVISSSARRAVDVNRDANDFKGKQCVSAKLFSKHMKIQEQTSFLAKNRTQFAVGTPNRIAALLQQEALNLSGTRYVVLDWNWRDVKFRRMCDIPELRADLFGLFEKYIIPQAKNGHKLKIGIF
ncbi:protein CMSS1-like [Asterias amurensis]|uniref:protein CMSS1-like n=1 Tax=Asterias amurensis TaxID=7602 RepID=UPI003AB8FB0E